MIDATGIKRLILSKLVSLLKKHSERKNIDGPEKAT